MLPDEMEGSLAPEGLPFLPIHPCVYSRRTRLRAYTRHGARRTASFATTIGFARVISDRGGPAPILWGWAEVVGSPPRSKEDSDLDARRPVYVASLDWPWPRLPPSIIPATSLAVACFATVTDVVVYACMPCSMSDWRAYVLRLLRDIMFSVPCICI